MLVIAVLQRRADAAEQLGQAFLAFDQRKRSKWDSIQVEQIKQEKHKRGSIPAVTGGLDHAERSRAVRPNAAKLAIEIRRADRQASARLRDLRVLLRPGEPC